MAAPYGGTQYLMEQLRIGVHCACFPGGGKAYPPLRICSTAAERIRETVRIQSTAVIATWKCRRCGTVHNLTAKDLHLSSVA